jgi:hypothetical protein
MGRPGVGGPAPTFAMSPRGTLFATEMGAISG